MNGGHGYEIAADVEVCDIIRGEIDGETPTGRSALEAVIEADGRGGLEKKVRC